MHKIRFVFIKLLFSFILAEPAVAAVTSEEELNTAIAASVTPLEIGADITLSGTKTIGYNAANLTGSSSQLYTMSGDGSFPLFHFPSNAGAGAISNLGFSGGNFFNYYGGAVSVNGNLNGDISRSTFSNNSALGGGAVYVNRDINGDISQSIFSNNSATSAGPNRAGGGALWVDGSINGGISESTFNDNSAALYGGAVYAFGGINNGISQSTFNSNSAAAGGAVYVSSNINGGISQSTFSNNSANRGGGGALGVVGSINGGISESTFSDNSAAAGGAVSVNGNLSGGISQSTFSGNSAAIYGGAAAVGGDLSGGISQSTFANNSALYYGGALSIQGNLDLNGEGALFTGNQATGVAGDKYAGRGGAIFFAAWKNPNAPVKTLSVSATPGSPIVFEGNTHNPGQAGTIPNSIYFGSFANTGNDGQVNATFNVEEGGALHMLDPMSSQEDNFTYSSETTFSNLTLNLNKTGPGVWTLAGHNDMQSATDWVISEGALHLVADASGAPAHINLANTTNAMGAADYAGFTLKSGTRLLLEPATQPHQISGRNITLEAGSSVGVQGFQYGPVLPKGRHQVLALTAENLNNQISVPQTKGTIIIGVNKYDYSNLAWDSADALYLDVGQARQDPPMSGTPAITGSSHIAAMNPAASAFARRSKSLFGTWSKSLCKERPASNLQPYTRPDSQYLNHLWVTPTYVNVHQNGGGSTGYSLQTPGIALGYDRQLGENAFMGTGISLSRPDYEGGRTEIDANDITFALYGGMRLPYALELDGHTGFGFTRYDQDRRIMTERYSTKYNGNNFFVGLGVGRPFDVGSGFSVRPGVAYDFIHLSIDGFDEGAGTYAIKADDYNQSIHRVKAGLDVNWTEVHSCLTVSGEAYYLGVYGDRNVNTTGHFVNDPINGFTLRSDDLDRDSLGLGLNVTLPVGERWEFGAGYNVLLGAEMVAQQGMLKAIFKF